MIRTTEELIASFATEIEVYVCWEWGSAPRRHTKPVLMMNSPDRELRDFDVHPMYKEILALADLAGRDDDCTMGPDSSGRPRFSKNFMLPVEWFHGCAWGD